MTTHNFAEFEEINDVEVVDEKVVPFNYCYYCETPMNKHQDSSYECIDCGYKKITVGDYTNADEADNGNSIKMYSRNGNVFSVNVDYTKTQRKQLMNELIILRDNSDEAIKIPLNILRETAELYNKIQSLVIEDNGSIVIDIGQINHREEGDNTKKWVKRGRIKRETLGAILYYVLIKHGVAREKNDVIKFMGFNSGGLSKGFQIIEELVKLGHIDDLAPYIDFNTSNSFIERYLSLLQLNNPNYEKFIIDIINESVKRRIGLNSYNNSKIVGTIYLLIKKLNLNITIEQIENACDKKRKNTFNNFTVAIEENILKFKHIFDQYGIPLGITNRIVKVRQNYADVIKFDRLNYIINGGDIYPKGDLLIPYVNEINEIYEDLLYDKIGKKDIVLTSENIHKKMKVISNFRYKYKKNVIAAISLRFATIDNILKHFNISSDELDIGLKMVLCASL